MLHKKLEDLIDTVDPMWPTVQEWCKKSSNSIEIMPQNRQKAKQLLYQLQMSTHSTLGSIIWESQGIWVWNRFMRILGSGGASMRAGIKEWNDPAIFAMTSYSPDSFIIIGNDVIGGFFALNTGGFSGKTGNIFYFAPDTLHWEDLEFSYTSFIQWAIGGDIHKFYSAFLWENYINEVPLIDSEHGVSFWPILWSQGVSINERSRKTVLLQELWQLQIDLAGQIANLEPGTSVHITFTEKD